MSAAPIGVGQDALEDVLNANAGRDYTVVRGDSPASIAKKFGVSLDQLLNANPQKATTVVKGVRTWTDLSINEGLNLPKAGVRLGYVTGVGDGTADVQWIQRALNKIGEYAQADVDLPPPWPTVAEDGVMSDPTKISIEVYRKVRGLGAGNLRNALAADIHAAAFGEEYGSYGAAWYPEWLKAAVKRGTRIWFKNQGSTDAQADALMAKIESDGKWPWLNAPKGTVNGAGVGDYATDTVRAVSGFDPCARENVRRVCAAQAAMGFRPDGKWGEDTYIAALGFNPQAPPPCQPRPAWWPPAGYGACAPTPNQVLVDAKKALAELKRLREGSGAMSGIRLNGAPIAGLGLGQDPAAPPAAAPPVVPDPVAQAQAAGAAADASGKAAMAARHTWAGWWHHLSTPAKIGVAAVPVVAVGTGVYLATHKKKGRGKRRSRR
jgi:hypothetical protein